VERIIFSICIKPKAGTLHGLFLGARLVACQAGNVDNEMQVAGRAGQESMPFARFNDEHVTLAQVYGLFFDPYIRFPASYQVDFGDVLVNVRFVHAGSGISNGNIQV
jgi:hypothetical protein